MKASNISINTCPILRSGKITDMSKRRKIHPTKIAKKKKNHNAYVRLIEKAQKAQPENVRLKSSKMKAR